MHPAAGEKVLQGLSIFVTDGAEFWVSKGVASWKTFLINTVCDDLLGPHQSLEWAPPLRTTTGGRSLNEAVVTQAMGLMETSERCTQLSYRRWTNWLHSERVSRDPQHSYMLPPVLWRFMV